MEVDEEGEMEMDEDEEMESEEEEEQNFGLILGNGFSLSTLAANTLKKE